MPKKEKALTKESVSNFVPTRVVLVCSSYYKYELYSKCMYMLFKYLNRFIKEKTCTMLDLSILYLETSNNNYTYKDIAGKLTISGNGGAAVLGLYTEFNDNTIQKLGAKKEDIDCINQFDVLTKVDSTLFIMDLDRTFFTLNHISEELLDSKVLKESNTKIIFSLKGDQDTFYTEKDMYDKIKNSGYSDDRHPFVIAMDAILDLIEQDEHFKRKTETYDLLLSQIDVFKHTIIQTEIINEQNNRCCISYDVNPLTKTLTSVLETMWFFNNIKKSVAVGNKFQLGTKYHIWNYKKSFINGLSEIEKKYQNNVNDIFYALISHIVTTFSKLSVSRAQPTKQNTNYRDISYFNQYKKCVTHILDFLSKRQIRIALDVDGVDTQTFFDVLTNNFPIIENNTEDTIFDLVNAVEMSYCDPKTGFRIEYPNSSFKYYKNFEYVESYYETVGFMMVYHLLCVLNTIKKLMNSDINLNRVSKYFSTDSNTFNAIMDIELFTRCTKDVWLKRETCNFIQKLNKEKLSAVFKNNFKYYKYIIQKFNLVNIDNTTIETDTLIKIPDKKRVTSDEITDFYLINYNKLNLEIGC